MDQQKDPDFDMKAFVELIKENKKAHGMSLAELAVRSGGDITAQTLNLYMAGRRFPGRQRGWLPLMRLFRLGKNHVLAVDKRTKTSSWLRSVSDNDLKPYPTDDWKNEPLTQDDLQFLLQTSKQLKTPMTRGQAVELLQKR